jgi:succinate dehydrogenase flavin-adding protein (antitoxin of CptAB toxin-antitoxin module)
MRTEQALREFIALLELEDKRKYEILMGSAQPLQKSADKDGWILLSVSAPFTVLTFTPMP